MSIFQGKSVHLLAKKILENFGCLVLSTGWPDLFVQRDGKTVLVEVKGPSDFLHAHQRTMHEFLRHEKLPVVVANTDRAGNIGTVEGPEEDAAAFRSLLGDDPSFTTEKLQGNMNNKMSYWTCPLCQEAKELREKVCTVCFERLETLGFRDIG